jgi:hypothetical protein
MPQLHLYVSESEALRIRERAEARGQSVSRYLAEVVKRDLGEEWPAEFFKEVVGGWKGGRLTRQPQGSVEVRDRL